MKKFCLFYMDSAKKSELIIDLRKNKMSNLNYNENITDVMRVLVKKITEQRVTDKDAKHFFRQRQISKAIRVIEQLPYKITSGKQIAKIIGIGEGIVSRVNEILKTGTLKEIEISNEAAESIIDLTKIHGIGINNARKYYYEKGITSVDDFQKAIEEGRVTISKNISIGLKYYSDLKHRIPRETIDQVKTYLTEHIKCHFDICGSYRRGKATCGDIDVLLKGGNLKQIINHLKEEGVLVADLTNSNIKKYMGVMLFNGKHLRIDFLKCEPEEYYCALLHFTGSKFFNQIIRSITDKKGYKLNEHGLIHRKTGDMVPVDSEEAVFKFLGIKYLSPVEREF